MALANTLRQVPSHFYSYSFALNPSWSQKFALQPEIRAYFEDVAAQYDILKHVRFGHEVLSASWEETSGTWMVETREVITGQAINRRCKILMSAVGALSIPKKCDLPGALSFQGRMFHTAEWDHTFDWSEKNVVVIGKMTAISRCVGFCLNWNQETDAVLLK